MTKKSVGINYFKNKVKELDEKKVYYLDKEKDEYITYSVRFSQSKIDEVMKELIETLIYFEKKEENQFKLKENVIKYLEFLTFKKFTDSEKYLKDKDFDYLLKFSEGLYDIGIIRLFIDNVFDSIEIDKVMDKLQELNEKTRLLIIENEKLLKAQEKLNRFKN